MSKWESATFLLEEGNGTAIRARRTGMRIDVSHVTPSVYNGAAHADRANARALLKGLRVDEIRHRIDCVSLCEIGKYAQVLLLEALEGLDLLEKTLGLDELREMANF